MTIKTLLAATAIAAATTGAASAATFTYTPTAVTGVNDFIGDITTFFGAGNVGFGFLTGVTAAAGGEVFTFKGYGSESGYTNTLEFAGTSPGSITELGANDAWMTGEGPKSSIFAGALTAADLKFTSSNASDAVFGDARFGIFYDTSGAKKTVFLAFDDQDSNAPDDNHDDLIVRVDTNVVPLPASALLLLGGLGGFAALRRRKKS